MDLLDSDRDEEECAEESDDATCGTPSPQLERVLPLSLDCVILLVDLGQQHRHREELDLDFRGQGVRHQQLHTDEVPDVGVVVVVRDNLRRTFSSGSCTTCTILMHQVTGCLITPRHQVCKFT